MADSGRSRSGNEGMDHRSIALAFYTGEISLQLSIMLRVATGSVVILSLSVSRYTYLVFLLSPLLQVATLSF